LQIIGEESEKNSNRARIEEKSNSTGRGIAIKGLGIV
jgi:hypothetical protein